ncbi:MAG: hypothetical protein P8077_03555, partial [Gammaproteobacteria bacterium]
ITLQRVGMLTLVMFLSSCQVNTILKPSAPDAGLPQHTLNFEDTTAKIRDLIAKGKIREATLHLAAAHQAITACTTPSTPSVASRAQADHNSTQDVSHADTHTVATKATCRCWQTELEKLETELNTYVTQTHEHLQNITMWQRALWLRHEIARLQLRVNSARFPWFAKFILHQRQREAQTLLRKLLKEAETFVATVESDAPFKKEGLLYILAGRVNTTPASSSQTLTTQALISQGFLPVLTPSLTRRWKAVQDALTARHRDSQLAASRDHSPSHQHRHISSKPASPTPSDKPHTPPSPSAVAASTASVSTSSDSTSKKQKIPELTRLLDNAVNQGDIAAIPPLLERLKDVSDLPLSSVIQVETIRNFLDQQVNLLDAQADKLYQTGNLADAKALWQFLLNTRPDDERIIAKIARAEKVLANLEALRQQPSADSTTEGQEADPKQSNININDDNQNDETDTNTDTDTNPTPTDEATYNDKFNE